MRVVDVSSNRRIVVLVNNLGSTTCMEISLAVRRAVIILGTTRSNINVMCAEQQGFVIERVLAGTFMTALDMAGISISVLPVDDDTLARLAYTTQALVYTFT